MGEVLIPNVKIDILSEWNLSMGKLKLLSEPQNWPFGFKYVQILSKDIKFRLRIQAQGLFLF